MTRDLIFRDVDGGVYQPVKHYNRATGKSAYRAKPPGASNETDDCIELDTIEEIARAMLVDGLPARVKALDGGPVNYLKFGAQKLVAYELDPDLARKIGVPAVSGSVPSQADSIRKYITENLVKPARSRRETSIEIISGDVHKSMRLQNALPAVCSVLEGAALGQIANMTLVERHSPIGSDKPSSTIRYRFALERASVMAIDRNAFDRLKLKFLALHPDFESFANCPSFAAREDGYKRKVINEAARLVTDMQDSNDADLGQRLVELLAGRAGLDCNLIDWRAQKVMDSARDADPERVTAAAGRLARTDDAADAVIAFVDEVWPILRGNLPSNPFAESRMFPTMLRALVDPQSVLPIRSSPTDNAARMLLGEPAFANAKLSRDEVLKVTTMAREMMRIMEEEWDWAPRDLWDVQGFIWETCQKRLQDDEMTDEELLRLFDSCYYFRTRRVNWSEQKTASFCRMARKAHELGFDWYRTDIPQIRFGRKESGAARASGTVACFHAAAARIQFTHRSGDLGLRGTFDCDPDGEKAFAETLERQRGKIANWMPPSPPRAGYWPGSDEAAVADDERNGPEMSKMPSPTNLILYGPPGTGKTYRTMEKAVELCGEVPAAERIELRGQYDRLRKEKRIEFVTFHQNFAYEEFVEGLRPETARGEGEVSNAGFELKPKLGIFRNVCQLAEAAADAAVGGKPFDLDGRRVFKMSLGRAGIEDHIFQDAIDNGYAVLGWGGDIDWSLYGSYEAIHERWNEDHPGTNGNDANIIQTSRFRADMEEGDIIVVTHGNKLIRAIGVVTGPYRFEPGDTRDYNHRRDVEWLKVFREPIDHTVIYDVPFIQWSCYLLKEQHLNRSALANLLPGTGGPAEPPKQYVLVIDEINRANISKVFGELITLIEPDKRLGMDEQLRVRLPYSEDEFGVPANLHIIGTMNTADRSIALLDTALRRRFRFEEMAPDTSVEAFQEAEMETGLPLADVLNTMNRRIEYLVDRDHRIGHAFFIGCRSVGDVDAVMRDKVIPLLQEYFFDDWSRLAAVLGEREKGGNFLTCQIIDDPMGEGGEPLQSWRVRDAFETEAYRRLVTGKSAPLLSEQGAEAA